MGSSVRIAGVPVVARVDFAAVAVAGAALQHDLALAAVWVVAITVAVLVHELGHALVVRTYGAQPHIVLWALGGSTHAPRLARGAQATVLLAGPASGILLGLPLLTLVQRDVVAPGFGAEALALAAVALVGWSVLSLLPLLPLDGGQLLALALGERGHVLGRHRAARVGVVVGCSAAVGAAAVGWWSAAGCLGALAGWNLLVALGWATEPGAQRQRRSADPTGPLADPTADPTAIATPQALVEAVRSLRSGAIDDALAALRRLASASQPAPVRRFATELTGWASIQIGDRAAVAGAIDELPRRHAGRTALAAALAVIDGDPRGPSLVAASLRNGGLGREVRDLAVGALAQASIAAEVAAAMLEDGDVEAAMSLLADLDRTGRHHQAVQVEEAILGDRR